MRSFPYFCRNAKTNKLAAASFGGGLAAGGGGGFKALDFNKLGGEACRSRKSKARDKGKKQHRRDEGR